MPELIDTSNPDKRNNLSIHMLKFQSKCQQQDNEDPREKFNKKKIRGGRLHFNYCQVWKFMVKFPL